jgi:hypothetical protein
MSAVHCVRPHTRTTIADLLRTTVWADGRVAGAEKTALRAAEVALGVPGLLEPVEERPESLFDLALDRFNLVEKHITYALAAWMTIADDVLTQSEALHLHRLRKHLGIDPDDAAYLEELAHAVRTRMGQPKPHFREVDIVAVAVARKHGRPSKAA